jgi:short-subunit dehydrogenase
MAGDRDQRQTWLVLGASSSVARAFARVAAGDGADVILAGRDTDDLKRTAGDVAIRTGGTVNVLPFDAEDPASHEAFAADVGKRADFLNVFLAFGAMPEQDEIEADFALAERTIAVNYTGAISLLHRLAPILEEQGDGHVVVLSSVAGDRGRLKNYVYGSAKAGLNTYLQGLRARLFRKGVSVTTVKPGFMDTDMTWGLEGMFLVASPEQAARACLKAAKKRRHVVYVPFFWWGIMTIIRHIPEFIFNAGRAGYADSGAWREKSPVSGSMTDSSPPEISNHAPCRPSRPFSSRIETQGKVRRLAIEWRIEMCSSAVCRSASVAQRLAVTASAAGASSSIHLPMKSPGDSGSAAGLSAAWMPPQRPWPSTTMCLTLRLWTANSSAAEVAWYSPSGV